MTSSIRWYALSKEVRQDNLNIVKRSQMNLNDYKLNVSSLRIDIEKGFDIEKSLPRNLPYNNQFWNSVTYELSRARL